MERYWKIFRDNINFKHVEFFHYCCNFFYSKYCYCYCCCLLGVFIWLWIFFFNMIIQFSCKEVSSGNCCFISMQESFDLSVSFFRNLRLFHWIWFPSFAQFSLFSLSGVQAWCEHRHVWGVPGVGNQWSGFSDKPGGGFKPLSSAAVWGGAPWCIQIYSPWGKWKEEKKTSEVQSTLHLFKAM